MADAALLFGSDLRLLANLTSQYDRERGSDLMTVERAEPRGTDLATLTGAENLQQALLLRFLTPLGELAELGHPTYGSRLSELIGELNNVTNRNRAKLYVLQALADEPRVRKVGAVTVTQSARDRSEADVSVSVLPIDSETALNLVFPFSFGGSA